MDPPPVQYVRTEDGFNIAYTVKGDGIPFVWMPWPFSHRALMWQTSFGRPLCEALAVRFQLVQYDSRGQGMSTRGLPEYHSLEDYETDLAEVVKRLGLKRFILYGGPLFNHVAARYAAKHPEQVSALILGDVGVNHAWGRLYDDLAREDWDLYLHTISSAFSLQGAPVELPYWRDSVTQDDCLAMIRVGLASSLQEIAGSIRTPTLILNTRRLTNDTPESGLATAGRELAVLIDGSRLVLFDGFASIWYSAGGDPPPAVPLIEDFVKDLGLIEPSGEPVNSEASRSAGKSLSLRETEVLSLVAEGKTNREIAELLVISERTVINHLSNIFTKTGAENRAAATAYALRHGLV